VITHGQWRAIEWTRHAATTVVVDDPTCVTGKRVIAECEIEDDARLIAAAPDLLERVDISAEHMRAAADVLLEHADQMEKMAMYNVAAHLRHNASILLSVTSNNLEAIAKASGSAA
jgi:hypothetical protein